MHCCIWKYSLPMQPSLLSSTTWVFMFLSGDGWESLCILPVLFCIVFNSPFWSAELLFSPSPAKVTVLSYQRNLVHCDKHHRHPVVDCYFCPVLEKAKSWSQVPALAPPATENKRPIHSNVDNDNHKHFLHLREHSSIDCILGGIKWLLVEWCSWLWIFR